MKILNLYAGIGGNRKLWGGDHTIVAVESEQYIADAYSKLYPDDTVIVGDAHQYLLDHHKEFDFIWASPPCPSHSRLSTGLTGHGIYRYPDMSLYQEIIFLKHFFKGKWLVENVIPYYDVLIHPIMVLDRHFFWSNFYFEPLKNTREYEGQLSDATVGQLKAAFDIDLPVGTKNARKLLRNAVNPKLGLHIFNAAQVKQGALLWA